MVTTVNIHEAKTHFSKLLERVRQGEEIIVAKAGKPVAKLAPMAPGAVRRVPGSARGKITLARDFDVPLPDELLDAFERGACCSTPTPSCSGSLPTPGTGGCGENSVASADARGGMISANLEVTWDVSVLELQFSSFVLGKPLPD